MEIRQAEMRVNLENVTGDVREIKQDLKDIKKILETQNKAITNQKEVAESRYVTKKFVVASMALVGTVLTLVAYFWQAINGLHK